MDSAPDIIASLKGRGAQLTVIGHQLEVVAAEGVIDEAIRASIKEHKNAILDQLLRESSVVIPPFSTSNVQRRMNLNSQKSRHQDHVRSMHRFSGEIDADAMSAAVQIMIQRNPTLTIRFIKSGGEILQQTTATGLFHIDSIDILDGEESREAARRYVERPFHMADDPMYRVGMTEADETGTRHLVSVVHHALADGYTNALITRTLSELYNQIKAGMSPGVPDPRAGLESYRRFCIESVSPRFGEESETIDELEGRLVAGFPVCDESSDSQADTDFALNNISTPPDTQRTLDEFVKEHSINLLSVAITAGQILMRRTHPEERGVIGCPISNRFSESLLDQTSNLTVDLAIPQDFEDSETVLDVLRRVNKDLLRRLDDPNEPIESLIARGHLPPRGRRRLRLPFSVGMYEFKSGLALTGVKTTRDFGSHENPFLGMAIRILHDDEVVDIEYEYDRTMVGDDRAGGLANAYLTIIQAMCEDPGKRVEEIRIDSDLTEGSRLTTLGPSDPNDEIRAHSSEAKKPTMLEVILASHWRRILNVGKIGPDDRFFQLGGSSLQLIQLIDSVGDTIGRQITLSDFIGDPTLMELARTLTSESASLTIPPTMEISPDARGIKVFCIPGQGGISAFTFADIARNLSSSARLIGLQIPGLNPDSERFDTMDGIVSQMADAIVDARDQEDPVIIIGHSAGGIIAMEIARTLQDRGIECLAPLLIGTAAPVRDSNKGLKERIQSGWRRRRMLKGAKKHGKALNLMQSGASHGAVEARLKESVDRMSLMISRFNPQRQYSSDIHLINDNGTRFCSADENTRRWCGLTDGEVNATFIDCEHLDLINRCEETIQGIIEAMAPSNVRV